MVAQIRGNHIKFSHPMQRPLANHPTYFLLGFSAALAPKFTPKWALEVGHVKHLGTKNSDSPRGLELDALP